MLLNNAKSVFQHVEKIASTSSKLEKEALVKEGMGLPLFAKVVRAAYDPFTTYGIRDVPGKQPGIAPGGNTLDEPAWWDMLDKLAKRELSGDAARAEVQRAMNFLTPESAELFKRIIKGDLRAGFTEGTVNRVAPGTIVEFPYMRCSLPDKSNMEKWDWTVGIISQLKADGMFCNVNKDATGFVWLASRQGSPFPQGCMPTLEQAIRDRIAPGTQTHGELVVYQAVTVELLADKVWKLLPREQGNGILNSLLSGGSLPEDHEVRFMAWDQIPLSAVKPKGKVETPYKQRLRALVPQLGSSSSPVSLTPTKIVKSKAEGMEHYRQLLRQGFEGTIWKHPDAVWKDGTSKGQVKGKLEVQVELKVVGFNEGTGKYEGQLGALRCESDCGELRVDVSGRGDAMRKEVWENQTSWLGQVVTVKANNLMEPQEGGLHSLFLPVFIERRTDKSTADTLQQIQDQFKAAIA